MSGCGIALRVAFAASNRRQLAPRYACSACFTEFRVTGEGDAPADVRPR